MMGLRLAVSGLVTAGLMAWTAAAQTMAMPSIGLNVDLTDAPRKILHSTEKLPVGPGALTLVYPKWIPGEHMPSGPIENMAGFVITANGQRVKWERDKVEMYAFHLTVPEGVAELEIRMDFLATGTSAGFSAGASTSANLALLSWNTLIVTPQGKKAAEVMVTPSLRVPAGWKFGTALEPDGAAAMGGSETKFRTVTLETLVDSPVLAGRYFREVALAPEVMPKHFLDMAADGPEDLLLSQAHIDNFSRLVRETGKLYQSRHYGAYHFLVTLSDQVAHFGLEHHQSSDDRVAEKTFVDDTQFTLGGLLLPHEFTHSWNGKYRRPAGLATGDYETPMQGDLLWVYEGLTEYLGDVLAARSGIWTAEQYRDRLAGVAGYLDNRPGRRWRDLQDTATMAQVLYLAGAPYDNYRRDVDYYDEGELLWLDVDTTIRNKTAGKKTLDDFVAKFHGLGGNTPPKVVPYTFEDVVAGLNSVVANDWAGFLRARLDSNEAGAPLGGIAGGGYKLAYSSKPSAWGALATTQSGTPGFWYSLGLSVDKAAAISDVRIDGPAYQAGLGPGMKVVAVNGRSFTPDALQAAAHDSKTTPVELIVENTGNYRVVKLEYSGGERYPVLERVAGTPDRIAEIVKSRE